MAIFRIIIFIPFCIGIFSNSISAETEMPLEDMILDNMSLDQIDTYWTSIGDEYGGYLPDLKKTSITEYIKKQDGFSLKQIFIGFFEFLLHEFIINGKLLSMLLLLTLFSVFLQTLHTSFQNSTVSKLAYFIVYIVLLFIALNSFYTVFTYAKEAIEMMSGFMLALIPLMLGFMATFGNVVTVTFFHPIIVFLVNSSGLLVGKFILPLLLLSALLIIVSSLSDRYKVTNLAKLFKSVAIGSLGVFLTIFLGVMSVQGATSAIRDGIGLKTAKFITANFIPVIGRTFTDATDTILSASLLLKNAIGMVGVVVIIFITIFPALKILAIAIIYKVAAAVLQPLGDGPVITSMETISQFIFYILACLLVVSFMFFLGIVIIIAASNLTMLIR
ncbi:MAG TPA: stage III sporulation protein AE [Cerasibacillus sp.]|uniref:stage III sporulation protein AE n=1 Tax=Cerasibacillus sp. TaxID=2498711 RepID=UPI002F418188